MRRVTHDEVVAAIRGAGVEAGDIVHVQSDLRSIGPVDCEPKQEKILAFYLTALQEAIGEEGTLTVCTAFEDYARYGTPFVLEESPSRVDGLSEYVRTRPGAVRSLHPIMSVTGLGRRAQEICGDAHYEGFSYDSPWGRLHRANAHIMTLGLDKDGGGTTFFHYVETLYGVPYKYTKVYDHPVYAGGKRVNALFTLSVRYLDFGIVNTPVRLKNRLLEVKKAHEVPLGRSVIWSSRAGDIVDEFMACLRKDRYFLLERPPKFRRGEIPADGLTGKMRAHYDRSEEKANQVDSKGGSDETR